MKYNPDSEPLSAPDPADHSTVYVVDDDPEIQKALARLLRSAGRRVETFGSAEEFLGRHPRPTRGTLLLDVRMPGMSGPELHMHLAEAGHELEVFFISSVEDERVRASALSQGARGWFSKPLDGEALLAAVGAV